MKKILAVATSDATELNGSKTGLWLSELTHFLDVIERAGYQYDLASPLGGKVPLDEKSSVQSQLRDPVNARFMGNPAFVEQLNHSLACADIDPEPYAAIYLAGGHGTMFDFRQSAALQELLTALWSRDRLVSAVCHGVSGLVGAQDQDHVGIIRGRRVTGFSNFEDLLGGTKRWMPYLLEDALKAEGAHYFKNLLPFTARVEVDGRLITGQNPQSAKGVAVALLKQLAQAREHAAVASAHS